MPTPKGKSNPNVVYYDAISETSVTESELGYTTIREGKNPGYYAIFIITYMYISKYKLSFGTELFQYFKFNNITYIVKSN